MQRFFFSLSIHMWIIKIHKYIFFTSRHKQQQQLQCRTAKFSWVHNCKDFFFSLYTHVTRVSLNVSFSTFFIFSTFLSPLPVVTEPLLWLSFSTTLRIALAVFLSMYCSLFLSSYAHLSLSLSKKISFSHYKSIIVNKYYIFFIFSWRQI